MVHRKTMGLIRWFRWIYCLWSFWGVFGICWLMTKGGILWPDDQTMLGMKNARGYAETHLVGGWATPLKNMTSSIGMIIPNIWENKKWQPNHQPGMYFSVGTYWKRMINGGFPKILGYPQKSSIFIDGFSHYKPSSYGGYPHDYGYPLVATWKHENLLRGRSIAVMPRLMRSRESSRFPVISMKIPQNHIGPHDEITIRSQVNHN